MNPIDTSGIITTFIDIPSTNFVNEWIGGEDGIPPIFSGTTVQQKQIDVTIELITCDYLDYQLLRDELYGMFGFNKPFFVVDKRQRGKRHKVVLDANFMPIRHNPINGTAVIPFITCEPHFAESIGTTADIDSNGINTGIWGKGMGLDDVDKSRLSYSLRISYNGVKDNQFLTPWQPEDNDMDLPMFSIFNAGNVSVHPFEQHLKIRLYNASNSLDFIKLENVTNGSYIKLNKGLWTSELIIDGPNVILDGVPGLGETDRTFISLDPGWNIFEVTGTEALNIEFDFRFYYL